MLRNIKDIKDLSLDSIFNRMRMYHKKFASLNNLTPQTENKEELKQEVLNNAGDIYNELYYIYKIKYNKKINSLDAKKRLGYKKLRLADIYDYLSDEEQKEKQEEKQEEKQKEEQEEEQEKEQVEEQNK